jgi:hypothetical protein
MAVRITLTKPSRRWSRVSTRANTIARISVSESWTRAVSLRVNSTTSVALEDGERWAFRPYLHIANVESLENGARPARRKRRS